MIAASTSKPSSNTDTGSKASAETSNTKTEPKKEVLTLSNSTVKDSGFGSMEVIGEAKNNDTSKHSATIKATFYDKDGKILGTAAGALNDVEPGLTKTFNLFTTDAVKGYATFKVEVDTLI